MDTLTKADLWAFEKDVWEAGYNCVAGVDEAGRGCLAGPVVAAAVILPKSFCCDGIRDSKVMTPAARNTAYERILREAAIGVGIIPAQTIDEINISQATHSAMKAALKDLSVAFDFVLVDGLAVHGLSMACRAIVKGDARSVSISAASIVAKVSRDRIMMDVHREFPKYGFDAHKGYGTAEHMATIREHGPCPYHRMSFAPICNGGRSCPLPGLE